MCFLLWDLVLASAKQTVMKLCYERFTAFDGTGFSHLQSYCKRNGTLAIQQHL